MSTAPPSGPDRCQQAAPVLLDSILLAKVQATVDEKIKVCVCVCVCVRERERERERERDSDDLLV